MRFWQRKEKTRQVFYEGELPIDITGGKSPASSYPGIAMNGPDCPAHRFLPLSQ
jgi:hypothetical protein